MEDFELKISSGIKKIKVNDHGDFIQLDTSDKTIFTRFVSLVDNIRAIQAGIETKSHDLETKYAGRKMFDDTDPEDIKVDTEQLREVGDLNIHGIEDIIREMDAVFGAECIRKVFRENYELNPSYVPDESGILDFLDAIRPIMEKLFGERQKRIQTKYSASFKGKNTKR